MLDFYNREIKPLMKRLDAQLNDRVTHDDENQVIIITRKGRTHVLFMDDTHVDELLEADFLRGVEGEQAFDPSERPF